MQRRFGPWQFVALHRALELTLDRGSLARRWCGSCDRTPQREPSDPCRCRHNGRTRHAKKPTKVWSDSECGLSAFRPRPKLVGVLLADGRITACYSFVQERLYRGAQTLEMSLKRWCQRIEPMNRSQVIRQ